MSVKTESSFIKWISMIICTGLMVLYLWLVLKVFLWIIMMFDWLTLEWLMANLELVVLGMFISLGILLIFPILLTLEFRKLGKKENN